MKRHRRAPRRSQGFSLLEAIVAMVLIGGAGMALFAWISGSIASLTQLREANQRSDVTVNVLEYMHRINPMVTPEGDARLGSHAIRWRASQLLGPADAVAHPRGLGLHELALYRTQVIVSAEDGKQWFELQLEQIGYRRVREPPKP